MNKSNKNLDIKKLSIVTIAAIVLVVIAFSIKVPGTGDSSKRSTNGSIPTVKDNDIVINTQDVTETASFYPAVIDGTDLEVIAVKAPDGTIRTAFNTCQVCYSSGRGYYEQEGSALICQNCGNRFGMDDVEVTRGGCNPVPITEEYKTVTEDSITVSKEFLQQVTVIFSNWK